MEREGNGESRSGESGMWREWEVKKVGNGEIGR